MAPLPRLSTLTSASTSALASASRSASTFGIAETGATGPAPSAAAALLARSVHVKVKPRPRCLDETRQILDVLRRFGEVEGMRHLKVYAIYFFVKEGVLVRVNACLRAEEPCLSSLYFDFFFPETKETKSSWIVSLHLFPKWA